MAIVTIVSEGRTLTEADEIARYLAGIGIDYERWSPSRPVGTDAASEEILAAYEQEIETLKRRGGYVTADVIDVVPATPGLSEMLARFDREHWHDEDEVRFVVGGRGLFHIRPTQGSVVSIEVAPGDLLRVPRGTKHWFHLCPEREIRAIRLFQDPAGWAPRYTGSGAERSCEPVCLGPAYVPKAGDAR